MLDATMLRTTSQILETVVTLLSDRELLPRPPEKLYHYATLETLQKIFEFDDLRLSHAEYSIDQNELVQAKAVINTRITSYYAGTPFFVQHVKQDFEAIADDLDAYIFCMSTGLPNVAKPQDMLSQWRAYAQDGRGGAITLEHRELSALAYHLPGLRLNPVVYERANQDAFVDAIITDGHARYLQGDPNAIAATVAALVFCTPLMKDAGFAEEREWRLLYVPLQEGPQPKLGFQPRRDFLAPYITLQDLWTRLRPLLIKIAGLHPPPPLNVPLPTGSPLVPIKDVMVGPSGHQLLNVRAMRKVVAEWRPSHSIAVDNSAIPYRSIA
jgi:hypothetical protein